MAETIAAIATALSASGIGIIRITDQRAGRSQAGFIVPREEKKISVKYLLIL